MAEVERRARAQVDAHVQAEMNRMTPELHGQAEAARAHVYRDMICVWRVLGLALSFSRSHAVAPRQPSTSPEMERVLAAARERTERANRHHAIREDVRAQVNERFPVAPGAPAQSFDAVEEANRRQAHAHQDDLRTQARARRLQASVDPLASQLRERLSDLEARRAAVWVSGCSASQHV